jgi:flagellar basal-body rod modification protein FlgD
MAIPPISGTGSGASAASAVSEATATSDRFLKLLVAQMQNQDPLSPMDNAQVTSQMAQINTVAGIDKLNATVAGLSSQFAQLQAVQGASLVGHDVVVPGNKLQIADAVGQGGFELAGPADNVKVEILAASGQVVDTLNLGAGTGGMHSFDWPAGNATTESGLRFRVTATSGATSTAATTLIRDRVDAITTAGNVFSLELANSGTVPYGAVRAFN